MIINKLNKFFVFFQIFKKSLSIAYI
ncbi:hypothetical protein A5875_002408, partial [Enterococcus sp. 3H8_DIV0648]